MKNVVFTFDDARKSFYTVAMPIMEKYSIKSTVFAIGKFLENTDQSHCSIDNLQIAIKKGHEVGMHSYEHKKTNPLTDYKKCYKTISNLLGIDSKSVAIPYNNKISRKLHNYFKQIHIHSICIGDHYQPFSLKRKFYSAMYLITKKDIFKLERDNILYSTYFKKKINVVNRITVFNNTTTEEIIQTINNTSKDATLVLVFHTIKNDKLKIDEGYDEGSCKSDVFENICKYVSLNKDIFCDTLNNVYNKYRKHI